MLLALLLSFNLCLNNPIGVLLRESIDTLKAPGTRHHGLSFLGTNTHPRLLGYSDAVFVGDLDDRRSRTGFVYTLGGTALSWGSHRQGSTADLTTRAEFIIACVEFVNKTDSLVKLPVDLGITQDLPIVIHCDNQAALALSKNPDYQNNKHADLKYYYITDARLSGLLDFQYIHTKDQLADVFTKPLP